MYIYNTQYNICVKVIFINDVRLCFHHVLKVQYRTSCKERETFYSVNVFLKLFFFFTKHQEMNRTETSEYNRSFEK